jgi:hypothetical protein
MNIFYLDTAPEKAAQMHCDKHCIKMILETAQLLCTAHRELDGNERADKYKLYKSGFKNHPSAKWVRESADNYLWAYYLFVNLCEEYEIRYNKNHMSERLLSPLKHLPFNISVDKDFTPPPQCMPDQYKGGDTVKAYRDYYLGEKMYFAQWQYTKKPDWVAA